MEDEKKYKLRIKQEEKRTAEKEGKMEPPHPLREREIYIKKKKEEKGEERGEMADKKEEKRREMK